MTSVLDAFESTSDPYETEFWMRDLRVKVGGVLPVHNEQFYLRYSLPYLAKAQLDELIFILDRCTDNSQKIIENWISVFNPSFEVKLFEKDVQKWLSPHAEAFQFGFERCSCDVIYSLAADCLYDPNIFRFNLLCDAITFSHVNRDLGISSFRQNYELALEKLTGFKREGTIFGVKRKAWKIVGGFKDHSENVLWHKHGLDFFRRLQQHGFKCWFYPSNCVHLRVNALTKEGQLKAGIIRRREGYPFLKVLLHSVVHLKPYVLRGYIQ